jgi:hypothetical protein
MNVLPIVFIVVRSLLNKTDMIKLKIKESLSSVTAKLNDANYFSWKKNEKHRIILNLEIQKNDQV